MRSVPVEGDLTAECACEKATRERGYMCGRERRKRQTEPAVGGLSIFRKEVTLVRVDEPCLFVFFKAKASLKLGSEETGL
jgi:hypothetical protein